MELQTTANEMLASFLMGENGGGLVESCYEIITSFGVYLSLEISLEIAWFLILLFLIVYYN